MVNTQLFEMIRALNEEERSEVMHFATIPFFNAGRMRAYVEPLIGVCVDYLEHNPDDNLEKTNVYSALFQDEKPVSGKLEKVFVEAQKLIRQYLLAKYYFREQNEFYQTFDFAEIARVKGLEGKYKQSMTRLIQMQEQAPAKNAIHFHQQFQLETAIHYVESIENQYRGDINIPNVLHATEMYYQIRKVTLLSRYLLQLKVAKLETPEFIQEQIENLQVPERCLEDSEQLKINLEIFKAMRKESLESSDIRALFNLLKTYEPKLDDETLQEFYTYLRNFAVLVIRTDRENYDTYHLHYELIRDNLKRGYLHYEGRLTPNRYLSIIMTATLVKEFEWALEILEENKNCLHGENEDSDIYRFTKARYLFAMGEFAECLDILPDNSPYIEFFLLGKRLEIMVYYELGSELLQFKLDAFKAYLSRTARKVLPDILREGQTSFINFLYQLVASVPGDKARSDRVAKRIRENKHVAEWHWVLEKAEALKR
ncbi:MAG: hypothetical protein R3A50_10060 [Saprospiraceae bacterium]